MHRKFYSASISILDSLSLKSFTAVCIKKKIFKLIKNIYHTIPHTVFTKFR